MTRLSGYGRVQTVTAPTVHAAGDPATQLPAGHSVARGLGKSYGDAALPARGGSAALTNTLDHVLEFDPARRTITVEAGVTLDTIARLALRHGLFLPVTPGTRHITAGGAVASDVHGKNHVQAGSVARHVTQLHLLTPQGHRTVTPADTLLWNATFGGMGLTGWILQMTFTLRSVPSRTMLVRHTPGRDLDAVLTDLSESTDEYAVAWVDTLAQGRHFGRGVTIHASHSPGLTRGPTPDFTLPVSLPRGALNAGTVSAFNQAYYAALSRRDTGLQDAYPYFYPLDSIQNFNRLYGPRGFYQFQFVLPEHTAARGLPVLLEAFTRARVPSFLAVLKRYGEESGGLLSFPMQGYGFALDVPASPHAADFLRSLEPALLAFGGRTYLAKDSLTTPGGLRVMYPHLPAFLEFKRELDPQMQLRSHLSDRLGLTFTP
ncbi:FAD-binding oxidoreductase [Deinococcus soli (ex Cha et al. 2016)]|uniref:FAD/FMN-containing dehydrogenase n=2 Tax=Deinococcus soli (ex Cha et al. 2016) TaxID=1309411 RepID=A0AAE3XCF5_9DEIO|nr:FAD-binding oxidoreductase [Deinococcus soli (ex Cha et al. 2016)]MDR6218476.1 FAD/FMN-containing dehydrogenase [Deinococcus soli (ex Cha et al. 2016)]MDR6329216.1 FAD/FMN-containing dehydrogenase [Deinococcus soli (ex Cha et al. 2016)]MDR6751489.1 FAD/FMN-containing dehydrogenase [Deinococcus soli (ex Cha et al. 2016)]